MRHFAYLKEPELDGLFRLPPREFTLRDNRNLAAVALGATLYMPATRPGLAEELAAAGRAGVLSVVVCLEDAIADDEVPLAEANLVSQLERYAGGPVDAPMVFVRVRTPGQLTDLTDRLGPLAGRLSGFVLPKFDQLRGRHFLAALRAANAAAHLSLLALPVLESPSVMYRESRVAELTAVARLLADHRSDVLGVRIGATDLAGLYALRRGRELTVYDVAVVRDVIADVVNVLGRADGSGFVVSGPVWEYFGGPDRLFKPQLRQTPFADEEAGRRLRSDLLRHDLDGLIREVVLDKANGLTGKSVIHPSHVPTVHALMVVTDEEYEDALAVLDADLGGVRRSSYRNKMNEAGPHRAWAQRVLLLAEAFGVARRGQGIADILAVLSSAASDATGR